MKKILFLIMGIVTLSVMSACNNKNTSNKAEVVETDSVIVDSVQVDSVDVNVTDSVVVSVE